MKEIKKLDIYKLSTVSVTNKKIFLRRKDFNNLYKGVKLFEAVSKKG